MAERSRKGPPPTKAERQRADKGRETATLYVDGHGNKRVATRCACEGRGCDACDGRGFTTSGVRGGASPVTDEDRRTNFGMF